MCTAEYRLELSTKRVASNRTQDYNSATVQRGLRMLFNSLVMGINSGSRHLRVAGKLHKR